MDRTDDTTVYAEEIEAIRWFLRRYPTVRDRLRYSRRKAADFAKLAGIARRRQARSST